MSYSIEARFCLASRQPAKIPTPQPAGPRTRIDDRIQKTLILDTTRGDQEIEPNQFYNDLPNREKMFYVGPEAIDDKYKEISARVIRPDGDEDWDEYRAKKTAYREQMRPLFEAELAERLGERKHLVPLITHWFSQNMLITLAGEVNDRTTKMDHGFFANEPGIENPHFKQRVTLHIPEDASESVTVVAEMEDLFQKYTSLDGRKENRPIELKGRAVCTIPTEGPSRVDIDFTLRDKREALEDWVDVQKPAPLPVRPRRGRSLISRIATTLAGVVFFGCRS